MEFTNIMKKLNGFVSPSANEKQLLCCVKEMISDYIPEEDIKFDTLGNLIAVMGKGCGKKVMFSAHSDTIGVIAHNVDEKGFVKVSPLGGLNPNTLSGRHIRFTNGVNGLMNFEEGTLEMGKAYVDIGAKNREEAIKMLPLGTAGSVVGEVFEMGAEDDKRIVSPFLDDRIAVAIQIEAIKKLYEEKTELKNEVYFVFSVQEELGIRGAKTAAYGIDPDYGIAIDVTGTGDTPKNDALNMKLGEGAAIKIKDQSVVCHKEMVDFLVDTAEKSGIKYQYDILPYGGTDAGAIHLTKCGVYSGGISIATRYIHMPTESVSINDCKNCVELICAAVKAGFTFGN